MPPKPKPRPAEDPASGGALDSEALAKLAQAQALSMQMQLATRAEEASLAVEERVATQRQLDQARRELEGERLRSQGLVRDMTRQYKSMSEELLGRISALEQANQQLRDQLEEQRQRGERQQRQQQEQLQQAQLDADMLRRRLAAVAEEFGDMLRDTLARMRERVEVGGGGSAAAGSGSAAAAVAAAAAAAASTGLAAFSELALQPRADEMHLPALSTAPAPAPASAHAGLARRG